MRTPMRGYKRSLGNQNAYLMSHIGKKEVAVRIT